MTDALEVTVNTEPLSDTLADPIGAALDAHVFGDMERAARRALADAAIASAELSITLVDDAAIRDLNQRYLHRDGVTDVIAFTLGEPEERPLMGDVYVGVEQAWRQAEEVGVAFREELVRLTIHGVLHVIGHDHPEGPERAGSAMFRIQERLLREVLDSD